MRSATQSYRDTLTDAVIGNECDFGEALLACMADRMDVPAYGDPGHALHCDEVRALADAILLELPRIARDAHAPWLVQFADAMSPSQAGRIAELERRLAATTAELVQAKDINEATARALSPDPQGPQGPFIPLFQAITKRVQEEAQRLAQRRRAEEQRRGY